MKCHKPHTDQSAFVQVLANGHPCMEYVLPPPPIDPDPDPNTLECFIPVSDGDYLTIKGEFRGTIMHGAIDLLADGSFLGDRRHEGSKAGELKTIKRKFEFLKVFDTPVPPNHQSIYPSTVVVEGDLRARRLHNPPTDMAGENYGVGSLVVHISVNKQPDDNYDPKYGSIICGSWGQKDTDEMYDAGIAPTHELGVSVTDRAVHLNRQSKHRRHAQQTRFGSKPWATFVFYYRTIAAIRGAGGLSRSDKSHALERVKDVSEDEVSTPEEEVEDTLSPNLANGMFVSPAPQSAEKKKPKPKLFGQSLLLNASKTPGPDEDAVTASAPTSVDTVDATPFPLFNEGAAPTPDSLFGDVFTGDADPMSASLFADFGRFSAEPYEVGSAVHDAEVFSDAGVHPKVQQAAPVPKMLSPITFQGSLPNPASFAPSTLPGIPTAAAAGTVSSQPQHGKPAAATTAFAGAPHHVPEGQLGVKDEPTDDGLLFNLAGTMIAEYNPRPKSSSQNTVSTSITPSKRSITTASPNASSRDSTPNTSNSKKKARMSDRKAALLAQLEEKKARNRQAKTALEEQKQLRAEEEHKRQAREAEENAELERLIAVEDEEFDLLELAVKSERQAWDEMMMVEGEDY